MNEYEILKDYRMIIDSKKILDDYNYNCLVPDENLVKEIMSIDDELSRKQAIVIANRYNKNTKLVDVVIPNINLAKAIYGLPGIVKAATKIAEHINKESSVLLVTDFDADGVTSASVLYKTFNDIFKYKKDNFEVIVNRRLDGTGFNSTLTNRILDMNKEKKVDLIIMADHGSSDKKSFLKFKEVGIDVIVTDHHQIPDDTIIDAVDGFVNPVLKGTDSVIDNISGCFVAFATMFATYKILTGKHSLKKFVPILPYVAISTITDMMSMYKPINRYIVKRGLIELNSLKDRRWLIIKNILKIKGLVNYKNIAYNIGPMINTGNRVDRELLVFNMLVSDNINDIKQYTFELVKLHNLRKQVQKTVMKVVESDVENYPYNDSVVLAIKTPYAINGIVSANIQGDVNKPTMCFIINDDSDILTGSCRADDTIHDVVGMFKYIDAKYNGVLIKYGGHTGAGGCSIHKDKLDVFKKAFNEAVVDTTKGVVAKKTFDIDLVIEDYELTPMLARSLENIGGYGKAWTPPVLLTELTIGRVLQLGKKFAIITFVTKSKRNLPVFYFIRSKNNINSDNIKDVLSRGTKVYLVYNLYLESYRGTIDYSVNILDIQVKG